MKHGTQQFELGIFISQSVPMRQEKLLPINLTGQRLKREGGKEPEYMGEDKEPLVLFTKNYLKDHPDINYFIYGHRHIMLDLMLSRTSRMLILGDWIQDFSYAVFDGENMFLEQYVEGESQYS